MFFNIHCALAFIRPSLISHQKVCPSSSVSMRHREGRPRAVRPGVVGQCAGAPASATDQRDQALGVGQ